MRSNKRVHPAPATVSMWKLGSKVNHVNGYPMATTASCPVLFVSGQPDCLVIRFEVEDHSNLPKSLTDFLQTQEAMQEEAQGGGTERPSQALGERYLHNIEITTYNPDDASKEMSYAEAAIGHTTSSKTPSSSSPLSTPPTLPHRDRIPFFSGIPSVDVIKGVLHLYKPKAQSNARASELVCALNIPAHQQLSDMLEFLSPVNSTIVRLRVIRDSTPNQYMLLITFKDKNSAEQFYRAYNGQLYNSMEKGICQLVYVSRVEIKRSSQGASRPSVGMIELPSCPVCLERLDESVLTILCNHSFHTQCLTRWEDSTCPICRYMQTPEPCGEENTCFSCDSKEDLWICLICGHVGCGRYVQGHANTHFAETQHTFSMQLHNKRVWDYIGDNYVHRLVQNKSDGKLVEVPGQGGTVADDEKIDSLQLEYTYLLTSQLESQRLFFEEKMARVEKQLNDELSVVEKRCRASVGEKERLEFKLMEMEKDKKATEKKVAQQQSKLTKLTADLKEEKEMNKCLSENQKLWKDRVTILEKKMDVTIHQKEQEMKDLQEQVRDLMFYIETQKKIADSPDAKKQEIQEGTLVVTQGASGSSSTPSRRTRKKK